MAGSTLAQTTVYVDGSVATTGDGTLAAPFKTIDEGLAGANQAILIAGGTYPDEPQYNSILSGQTIIGGYDSSFNTCDPEATPTIIDMGGVPLENQHGTFVVNGASGWTIENLVIQNSSTGASGDSEHGGGIYVRGGSGTFRNVTFFKCAAVYEDGTGGAARGGGAVAINYGMYNRCLFTNCGGPDAAVIRDGGTGSQIDIINCVFADNGVDVITPAEILPSEYLFAIADLQALIYNCTFVGNTCPAGYMFEFRDSGDGATKEVVNCIFADNTVGGGSGTAIFSYAEGYDDATILQNNLFFSNSGMDPLDPTRATIIDTNGNIAGDPQFVDAANGDYHLKAGSPGEDAGQTLELVFDDFVRTLRPVGSAYDIGALEGQGMNPKVRGVMAAASSSLNADLGPENTVDESGLNPWGQHDTMPTNMWLSSVGQEPPVWIQYEFDIVHKLDQMWIWNSNTALEPIVGLGGLGVKTATIEYSTDGTTWTALVDVPEFGQATGTDDYTHNTTVYFNGVAAKFVKITCTSSWGGGGQYGLSEVRFFYIPVRAREPNPQSGAKDVDLDVVLSWTAGREAVEHRVFISNDMKAVIAGIAPVETVTEARYDPQPLDLGRTYYWRVDEVNDSETPDTWEGEVWNFATRDFLTVDDFEKYDAEDQIWWNWVDGLGYLKPDTPPHPGNGTGAEVGDTNSPSYTEETIVHSGRQSMPYWYNNNKAPDPISGQTYSKYSEAKLTLSDTRNWTEENVKALSLWFYGDPANAAEQMYLAVANNTGQPAVVVHDDPNAAQIDTWTEWNIDLRDFAGINLTDVNSIAVGLGNRNNPQAGGSGKMYFDDIRLYRARCVPSILKPDADLSGNCVVDLADIEIMAADWLADAPGLAADLNADDTVDFKDYAVLADDWLGEQLWQAW
jgi:hypothetical protein